MRDPYSEFETIVLPNGLTVHVAHWPGVAWQYAGFMVHSGCSSDPVGKEGVAHFTEHLVSGNIGISFGEIMKFFEAVGGGASLGTTGYFYTHYSFKGLANARFLAQAFSIFGSMLLTAKLENFFEHERRVIQGEFQKKNSVPHEFEITKLWRKVMYEGHWAERFPAGPLGVPSTIARITQEDAQFYYDQNYTPSNISVVCLGGMKLKEIVSLLVESPFGVVKDGVRRKISVPLRDVRAPSLLHHTIEMSKNLTSETRMIVGEYESTAKIPGIVSSYTLEFFSQLLNRILFEEVREKRSWAYSIGTSGFNFHEFSSCSIECKGLALEGLDEIEGVVEKCVESVPLREDLFSQEKTSREASRLMRDFNGSSVFNSAFKDLADKQRIVTLAEYDGGFDAVTIDDVREVVPWILRPQRFTILTRP